MGYWPSLFGQDGWILVKFMNRDDVEVHKHAKKKIIIITRLISIHLDRTSLVNKRFIIWDKTPKKWSLLLRDQARIPSGKDSSIRPITAQDLVHLARSRSLISLLRGDGLTTSATIAGKLRSGSKIEDAWLLGVRIRITNSALFIIHGQDSRQSSPRQQVTTERAQDNWAISLTLITFPRSALFVDCVMVEAYLDTDYKGA